MRDIEEIRKIASEVRQAMQEMLANNEISPTLNPFCNFPRGCCGDMSIILSTHFTNLGFPQPDYIWGRHFEDGHSHAWIRINGICIDITADQFSGQNYPAVIVEYEKDYPLKDIYLTDRKPSQYQIDMNHLRHMYTQIEDHLKLKKS